MKTLHRKALVLALLTSVCCVAGAQATATSPAATETAPPKVVPAEPSKLEVVSRLNVVYSNVYTHQFNFSVVPNSPAIGYKFGGQSDAWMLSQMDPKKLSSELKFITVKVINNAASPTAVGTKAELEVIGKAVLATVNARGFDVTFAKVFTSQTNENQTNEKVIDLDRHPTANVLVSISSREGE